MRARGDEGATARSGRKRAKIPPNAVRYIDMYQIMRTFVESGYSNTMILDHTPRFVEGYEAAGTAYAIGYMRALVERAEAELSAG